MFRWHKPAVWIAMAMTLGAGSPLLAHAQSLGERSQAAPMAPRHAPHHPHLGTISEVNANQITVQYPIDSPIPGIDIPLAGTHLRAGFYPVTSLPFAPGQHVFVTGLKSAHPTVMLLPEARGTLAKTDASWALQTTQTSIPLSLTRPVLLGGATLTPGAKVDVFGTRSGSQIQVALLAATPHVVRATVTTIDKNRIGLKTDTGTRLTYAVTNLPSEWTRRLSQLKPATPVLAVISPQGQVLGMLPMHASWSQPRTSNDR